MGHGIAVDPVPGLPYRGQTNLATWINCESKVFTGAMETFALKMGVLVCWSGSVASLSSSLGQPARSISRWKHPLMSLGTGQEWYCADQEQIEEYLISLSAVAFQWTRSHAGLMIQHWLMESNRGNRMPCSQSTAPGPAQDRWQNIDRHLRSINMFENALFWTCSRIM